MTHTLRDEPLDLGTEDGIEEAWLTHRPELRSFAARRLRDRDLADDAVQETFLRAWRKADRFDATRGSVRTWLFAILRNLLVDMARAQASRPRTRALVTDVATYDEYDGLLGSLAVADALKTLSVEHQEVIRHSYITQRSHIEIARLLGIPVGTVRSRLFYAREALGRALRKSDEIECARLSLHAAA